jgi:hypothetical protein
VGPQHDPKYHGIAEITNHTDPNRISAGESLRIAMIWEYLASTIPASFMSAIFLYDAIHNDRSEDETIEAVVPPTFSRQKILASVPNVITLSQNVSVVEEYAMDSKAERAENEKMFKAYRYR